MKILIVRLSSIGDIVLTTAFTRLLKKKFPFAQIDFLLYKPFKLIYEYNPNINHLFTIEKNIPDYTMNQIKDGIIQNQGRYDLIFDLQNNAMSSKFTKDLGVELLKVDKRRAYKLKLVWLKSGKGEDYKMIHDVYTETLLGFDVYDDNLGLEFRLSGEKEMKNYPPLSKIYQKKELYNISVAPGAHFKTKQWGHVNFAHLIRKLNHISQSVTLFGGVNDISLGEKIKELNPDTINLCGKTNLEETCRQIDNTDLLITNDTGIMHIAAARKIPTLAIFGSSVRELGFEPYAVPNVILETELWCRPCSHIGRRSCPLIHFNCMKKITPQFAFDSTVSFLNQVYNQ
ncbi:MAG: glycosyltransferase family 9 protein [Candidatus Kapabacteria bacterium]|jgi:heptosyltransferase-2|nr:glycosyltransferase family 9 protein [Candidatus Kapabacteria bacterium]